MQSLTTVTRLRDMWKIPQSFSEEDARQEVVDNWIKTIELKFENFPPDDKVNLTYFFETA